MSQELTIIEPEDDLGPAMLALTTLQRRYVYHQLLMGGQASASDSVRAAGYADDGKNTSVNVTAFRLAHNPKILAALREEADNRLRSGAVLGASALIEIAKDTMHKDRFKAASALLDRAGLLVEHKQTVIVEHKATESEKVAEVIALAREMGLDPKALLGRAGITIDAEFTEVEVSDTTSDEPDPWSIEPGEFQ